MKRTVQFAVLMSAIQVLMGCRGTAMNFDNRRFAAPVLVNISVDTENGGKPISPYIYGINSTPSKLFVITTASRLGGNRTTGYNWENNLSNAGEDWRHYNDEYMFPKGKDGSIPAIAVTDFVENAKKNNAYALITLPMAGYVANDNLRTVRPEETAPSERFAKIIDRKNTPLSLNPDLKDGVVYSDEFINYLIKKCGTSHNGGIDGYSLDNEPSIWPGTHPRIHPDKTTIAEILEKSVSLASVVKDLDPNAEVFGPALYGLNAYASFQDAPDWKDGYAKEYRWFIDAYLDGMRKAEKGRRLLDALDIHYYTEARSPLDHRVCEDNDTDEQCIYTRLQSTRTLWDSTYRENSWVQRNLSGFLPVLPAVNASIEKYYPGTKLSVSEYNFGNENHISGGIAQADALGIFAGHGVYFAALWSMNNRPMYAYAGINLYTNYDGKGGTFGNTLVESSTDNIEYSSVYASTDDSGALHIVLLNKSQRDTLRFSIAVRSPSTYKKFACYGFNADSPVIKAVGSGAVEGNEVYTLRCDLPRMSAYHLVLTAE
ncbi:MAG: glycoside hydrolase family 44 protein [Treponema sp.]|jgi:mannan endo-1,4-beta-mannosidase|nr:glycoside hydrolase family 44 protein [Treponema sp.]